MNIRDIVRSIVREELEAMWTVDSDAPAMVTDTPEVDEQTEASAARGGKRTVQARRNLIGRRKVYRVLNKRKHEAGLFRTADLAYAFMLKAGKPLTMPQISAGTKLKPKTTESVLFNLRRAGLVESEYVDVPAGR